MNSYNSSVDKLNTLKVCNDKHVVEKETRRTLAKTASKKNVVGIKFVTIFTIIHHRYKGDGLLICDTIDLIEKHLSKRPWESGFLSSHYISSNKMADINSQNTKDYTMSCKAQYRPACMECFHQLCQKVGIWISDIEPHFDKNNTFYVFSCQFYIT